LTNGSGQNIIASIRGSRRQVADIKSESAAGFLLECLAGFVGNRTVVGAKADRDAHDLS
jgi:hypothetical protein